MSKNKEISNLFLQKQKVDKNHKISSFFICQKRFQQHWCFYDNISSCRINAPLMKTNNYFLKEDGIFSNFQVFEKIRSQLLSCALSNVKKRVNFVILELFKIGICC